MPQTSTRCSMPPLMPQPATPKPDYRLIPQSLVLRGFVHFESMNMSQSPSLAQLQQSAAFLRRHLGPDAPEQQAMLAAMGLSSRAELIEQTVPPAIRLNRPLELPAALDEEAALDKLRGYAAPNQPVP